jgi:hypothetical protein
VVVVTAAESGTGAGTVVVTAAVVLPPKQVPLLQILPEPQVFPHHPQLPESACRFRQIPLHGVYPVGQEKPLTVVRLPAGAAVVMPVTGILIVPVVQIPLLQYWEALHTLLQRPQLLVSVSVFRQIPLQGVWPPAQPAAGTAADGVADTDMAGEPVCPSVINGGAVLLDCDSGYLVQPLKRTMQMMDRTINTRAPREIFID